MGGHHSEKGDEHERQSVEQVTNHGTSDSAHPKAFALSLLFDTLHDPCVREFAEQKSCKRSDNDARHIGEDVIVRPSRLCKIVGRRQPHAYLCARHHDDVAEEREPNHLLCRAKSPYLGEHVAKHISKRKCDSSRVEIEDSEDADDLHSHHVRYEIKSNKKCRHDNQRHRHRLA